MYSNYIRLTVDGITRGTSLHDACILLFRESNGRRILPVMITPDEYTQLQAALERKDYTISHLMLRLANRAGMPMLGVRLLHPEGGHTVSLMDFDREGELISFTAPIAQATIAALEAKCPVVILREAFERQGNNPNSEGTMALPIKGMTDALLEEAMQTAVANDNFELATIIRDELRSREAKKSDSSQSLQEE